MFHFKSFLDAWEHVAHDCGRKVASGLALHLIRHQVRRELIIVLDFAVTGNRTLLIATNAATKLLALPLWLCSFLDAYFICLLEPADRLLVVIF